MKTLQQIMTKIASQYIPRTSIEQEERVGAAILEDIEQCGYVVVHRESKLLVTNKS